MYDERIKAIVQNHPELNYLKKIAESGILIISPEVEKYKTDPEQLLIPGYNFKKISKKFIVDIIANDEYFSKIKEIYEKGLFSVVALFINEKGKALDQYSLNRMMIIHLLEKIDKNEFPSISERYDELMSYVSYENYKEQTYEDNYEVTIDGEKYSFPVRVFYQFMDLPTEEFNSLMEKEDILGNIPIAHFLYAVNKYYEDKKIKTDYLVDDNLKDRLKSITSSDIVDVQMINKYLDTSDSMLEQIQVDVELEDFLLSGIDPEFNSLEKAIYIYIKMCKTLTYDEEFYAVNQSGPLVQKHKTIDHISSISLENNEVVCYEFNAIYSYLLHKIGINYKNFVGVVEFNGEDGEAEFDDDYYQYSEGHTFLKCRCGKYLVKADSVTSILQGDIVQAKLNQQLTGLVCENKNSKTRAEFEDEVAKVYQYIAEREPKISQNVINGLESFDDIVAQFLQKTDKIEKVGLQEKIDILIDKVNSSKLVGIDAYSYLLQLRKILFSRREQNDNIRISIIRNTLENAAQALAIISLKHPNEKGKLVIDRYRYEPGLNLLLVARDELQRLFDNDTMGYIDVEDPTIPGIKDRRKK